MPAQEPSENSSAPLGLPHEPDEIVADPDAVADERVHNGAAVFLLDDEFEFALGGSARTVLPDM